MRSAARPITVQDLRGQLVSGDEMALLDLREEGIFCTGHLLLAVPVPLSRLELLIDDLVPRKDVPIVLLSGGADDSRLIVKGSERLGKFGYTNVSYLDGGVQAWKSFGYEVFEGVHVLSKAFGEFIEDQYSTPHVSAEVLRKWKENKANLVILDSRPMNEFEVMSIPGASNVPGSELVLRIHDVAPDAATTIVVNCAGRTRSIIGAQSLINAGVSNKVVALKDGTQGWHLAGYELEKGQTRSFPAVSPGGLKKAIDAAERIARRFHVQEIDSAMLTGMQAERNRTLYIFDVRDHSEYEAGHLACARPAPGVQLVQATDSYIGVRGARVVLVDDNGVRAKVTASWLLQMGLRDVYVLKDALRFAPLTTGPYQARLLGGDRNTPAEITVRALSRLVEIGGIEIVDVGDSRLHRSRHIPGSRFAMRSNLPGNLDPLPKHSQIVLTSEDGVVARLAAQDIANCGRNIAVVVGGTSAWIEAGLPVKSGFKDALDEPKDFWYRPYDLEEGVEAAMKHYLSWEVDLIRQLERDGTCQFQRS